MEQGRSLLLLSIFYYNFKGNGKVQRHLGDRGLCLIGALVATIAIAIGFIGLSNQHLHLPSAFVCESYHAISRYITDCFFDRKPATMAWQCTGRSNFQLIENLFTADLIKSQRVKNAMLKVSKEDLSCIFGCCCRYSRLTSFPEPG